MTEDELDKALGRVTTEMKEYVDRFVTPLVMSEEHGTGTAWGTGTYIRGVDLTWVLTAAHAVTEVPHGGRLAHLPVVGQEYNAAFGKAEVAPWPIDAAALPIYPDASFLPPEYRVVLPESVETIYNPVDEEMLYFSGFPGYALERNDFRRAGALRKVVFGQITTPVKPMLTQAVDSGEIRASNFDADRHVAVSYPLTATRASDGETVILPNAAGMSGSALWDTKFVECAIKGRPWGPHLAKICGMVWAVLDNPEVIFVTKIEHVRASLPAVFSV